MEIFASTPRHRRDACSKAWRRRLVHPTHCLISTQVHCKAGHGRSAAVAYAWLVFADRGATSPRAVYAAFARKRNVRRGLWRQPNVAALAEQLALSDYKTPATRS